MKKNNSPLAKLAIGILLFLIAMVFTTTHITKYMCMPVEIKASRFHNNFFEYLASLIGIHFHHSSSSESSNNNISNQLDLNTGQRKNSNSKNQHKFDLTTESSLENTLGSQTPSADQENSTGNSIGVTVENSVDNNTPNATDNSTENSSPNNAENNPTSDTENSLDNNLETIAANNSNSSAKNNSIENSNNNSDNSNGSSNNTPSSYNPLSHNDTPSPDDLPTINPIPSNTTVSETITKQNQQNTTLLSLLAARQELVIPVQQTTQNNKYQTVNSQNIPAPSTDAPPAEAVARMKSNQKIYQ